jgi:hypothetical protein
MATDSGMDTDTTPHTALPLIWSWIDMVFTMSVRTRTIASGAADFKPLLIPMAVPNGSAVCSAELSVNTNLIGESMRADKSTASYLQIVVFVTC